MLSMGGCEGERESRGKEGVGGWMRKEGGQVGMSYGEGCDARERRENRWID